MTGELDAESLARVYYPKTRVDSLKDGDSDAGILNWERTFAQKQRMVNQQLVVSRKNGKIDPLYGYMKVNIDEILSGENFKSNAAANPTPLSIDGLISGAGFNNTEPGDDTFFEVQLSCDDGWLDIDQASPGVGSRNLISFCQLDIKKLSEEYGLKNFVGTLKEFGGPMHYEKLLDLSPFVAPTGRARASSQKRAWFVPTTAEYFEDQEGNPWNGLAHYHPDIEGQRGPDGYVGWMSGPAGGDMAGRRLLSRRQIQNTKVVSKIHIGAALGFDGMPLSEKNTFLGYPDATNTEGDSVPSPYGSLSFGDNILSVLRSEVGMGMLEVRQDEEDNALNTIAGSKMRKLVLKKEMQDTPNFIDWAATYLSIADSKYSTFFTTNKEQILKSNSQYSYLLDFHREVINPEFYSEQNLMRNATESEINSYNFVKSCIENTRIYTMKISRRRVTNQPISNNSMSVPDYSNYDNNQIEEILVNFSDSNDLPAGVDEDDERKADLIEVFKDFYISRGISSLFRLDDYDLYENITQGRYKYSAELTILDGVDISLKRLHSRLQSAMKSFERYVKEAEKPYFVFADFIIRSDGDEQLDNRGSYDYETEQFSQYFIEERSDEFIGAIETAVATAFEVSYLLTKKENFNNDLKNETIRNLKPDTADIGNLKMFFDFLQKIESSLRKRIFKNNTDIASTMNLGTHKRMVNLGVIAPSNLITIKSDIGGSVKVESKNSVFYNVENAEDDDRRQVAEFFTLETIVSDRSPAETQNTNPDVELPAFFNSAGAQINRGALYRVRSIGSYEENYSEIISATEYSPYGETYDSNTSTQHTDPLNSHNSSLNNFGGTTFNYLLTKTMSLSEISTNECGEQVATIPSTVEQSILESIVEVDNREDFLDQVEEQYKDYYFTKEALGNLYNFIRHTISNRNALRSMNTDNENRRSRSQGYQQRVQQGTSTEQARSQQRNLRRQNISTENVELYDRYVYTASKGFVLASTEPVDSLGMYMYMPKNNIKTKNGTQPVMVDNVYINEEQGPRSSGRSSGPGFRQRAAQGLGSGRSASTPSSATTTIVGGGTSGY